MTGGADRVSADITLGSIPSLGWGWQLSSVVDQTTGQIGIELYSMTPITTTQAGSLVTVSFHVLPDVTVPGTAVYLMDSVRPHGWYFGTVLADTEGALILTPGLVDKVFADLSL